MKKNSVLIVVALLVASVMVSCQKDGDTFVMKASVKKYDTNSKIIIDDNRMAHWVNQDKVNINGQELSVSVTPGTNGYATIANVNVNESGYYAVYPASMTTNTGSGFPSVNLPQVQTYRESDGRQVVDAPMAAYCSNSGIRALQFVNLCSLLKVSLTNPQQVAYITVSTERNDNNTNNLWGTSTITKQDDGQIVMSVPTNTDANANLVMLDCRNNGTGWSSADRDFYVVLPSVDLKHVEVEIYVYEQFGNNNPRNGERTMAYLQKSEYNLSLVSNKMYSYNVSNTANWQYKDLPSEEASEQGGFTVASNSKVLFSSGNLQYRASDQTWRFAEHQWDSYLTGGGNQTTTANGRDSQTNYIDLFGWATSGNSETYWTIFIGTVTLSHSPTLVSNDDSQYPPHYIYINAISDAQLTGTYAQYDWGVHNAIGSDPAGTWRCLLKGEWDYLLNSRTMKKVNNNTVPQAKVVTITDIPDAGSKKGMVIYPDNFNPKNTSLWTIYCNSNNIAYSDWQYMEHCGCVFLPVTGTRSGTTVNNTDQGRYWSASNSDLTGNISASAPYFETSIAGHNSWGSEMKTGYAVRLVKDM